MPWALNWGGEGSALLVGRSLNRGKWEALRDKIKWCLSKHSASSQDIWYEAVFRVVSDGAPGNEAANQAAEEAVGHNPNARNPLFVRQWETNGRYPGKRPSMAESSSDSGFGQERGHLLVKIEFDKVAKKPTRWSPRRISKSENFSIHTRLQDRRLSTMEELLLRLDDKHKAFNFDGGLITTSYSSWAETQKDVCSTVSIISLS